MTPTLKPGDILRDNAPRSNGRTVRVVAVGDASVIADGGRRVRIALSRIYDDGKVRRSGFSVVREGGLLGGKDGR